MITLSSEEIEKNFSDFISILGNAIANRPGANWEGLKNKLETSDFKVAPASSRFHGSYEGGLCDHSLNVYYNMCSLVKNKHLEDQISQESIAIVALLHDFSKINLYTKSARNKKVYSEFGSKHDELGNFDWVSEMGYAMIDEDKRFIYGNHEETSEFMVRSYIPLKYEESLAILNHHMGMGYDSAQGGIGFRAACKYPIVALLHMADFVATTIDERE